MKFLHVGDVHIGKERLDGRLPSSDFSAAFNQAVDAAITEKVDFVLVAGDFFDKSRIEPNHLSEGEEGLGRLRAASIPVIAIEGNHDIVSSFDGRESWLTYLNARGLVRLLRTEFDGAEPAMREWTAADPRGNWVDIAGARIVGAGYFGASTKKRLDLLAPKLEKRPFTILMLHAAVDHLHDEFGHVNSADLGPIREKVDYLALGHIHRNEELDGWIFNPGAMENWRLDEEENGIDHGGYFLVAVTDGTVHAVHRQVQRRPVIISKIDCDNLASIADLDGLAVAVAATWNLTATTAVQVRLTGLPRFDPWQLDLGSIAAAIHARFPCKAIEIVPAFGHRQLGRSGDGDEPPRDQIEREELLKLIEATGRYAGREKQMLALIQETIDGALQGMGEDELYARIRRKPLVGETDVEPASNPAVEHQVVPGEQPADRPR